jgi:hypothetical protein
VVRPHASAWNVSSDTMESRISRRRYLTGAHLHMRRYLKHPHIIEPAKPLRDCFPDEGISLVPPLFGDSEAADMTLSSYPTPRDLYFETPCSRWHSLQPGMPKPLVSAHDPTQSTEISAPRLDALNGTALVRVC